MDGKSANLGATSIERSWYRPGLGTIAIKGERLERGCGQIDRVPF